MPVVWLELVQTIINSAYRNFSPLLAAKTRRIEIDPLVIMVVQREIDNSELL